MYKNVASQKIAVFAYDTSAEAPKTGDAAQITAQISLDGGATAATDDTNPTELDSTDAPGIYIFDMTQAETNAGMIVLSAVSSTANITLEPVILYTQTVMRGTDDAATSAKQDTMETTLNDVPTTAEFEARTLVSADYVVVGDTIAGVTTVGTCTTNSDMRGTDDAALASVLGSAVGASISADIAAVKTVADTLDTLTQAAGDGDLAAILADTNELQTDDYPTSIAAVKSVVDDILEDTGTTIPGTITTAQADLDIITDTDGVILGADTITAIWDKAMSDLAQGAPSATASVLTAINWLYEAWRNKTETTATTTTIYKDDGTTELAKSTLSDNGTTFTKAEFVTGA